MILRRFKYRFVSIRTKIKIFELAECCVVILRRGAVVDENEKFVKGKNRSRTVKTGNAKIQILTYIKAL